MATWQLLQPLCCPAVVGLAGPVVKGEQTAGPGLPREHPWTERCRSLRADPRQTAQGT